MQLKIIVATLALLLVVSCQVAYGSSTLDDIREYVFTDCANDQGLTGNGINIGVWETATKTPSFSSEINSSRNELSGRVTVLDDHVNISDHATNVALILASNSNNEQYDGMATDIEIDSYDISDLYNELLASNVDISTNSFGENQSLGEYTSGDDWSSDQFDAAIRAEGIIAFKSAGNKNKNANNYFTITSPGTAKNIITVGAVDESTFSEVASFSSFGPCKDGRLKPEIVATGAGMQIDETDTYDGTDAVRPQKGTSYATPVVSGSSSLILEHWKNTHPNEDMLPSTMKALLVHTANNDGNGPTYRYGYGMLDTKEALDLVELDTEKDKTIIQDDTTFTSRYDTNQTIYKFDVPANTGELKVTLAWSDVEGSKYPNQKDLINDINLVVYKSDDVSTYYYPWILNSDPAYVENPATKAEDHSNPLEQVQIEDPISGEYSIKVDGTFIEGPQNFSLIITTKPKITVYSDKEGAQVYVNSKGEFGHPDGVINNGVAEIFAYAGENQITVKPLDDDISPARLDCNVTAGEAQEYYSYFESYSLDLNSGTQVISLPFDVTASEIISPSNAEIFLLDDYTLTLSAISSSGNVEKGKSYMINSPTDCSIDIHTQFTDFSIKRYYDNYGFVGAPPSTMKLFDFLGLDSYAERTLVYKYYPETDDYVLVGPDENVNPGDSIFVFFVDMLEVIL